MTTPRLVSVDRPDLAPLPISQRLRSQLVYFVAARDGSGVPELAEDEFWFDLDEVRKALDEGVIYLISPLDSENHTEVELSDEQEALLEWLLDNEVRRVRVEGV